MANTANLTTKVSTNGGGQRIWLHRFAIVTSALTFFLIFVGGLVKSHEAGLSVPDWPNTYGQFMLTFPYRDWVGNIFYEHSHRLLATLVGYLMTVQAIWVQRVDRRLWVKRLGWAMLFAVILQGVLGGLTVLFFLPTAISSSHAALAQITFCLTILMSLVTSPKWDDSRTSSPDPTSHGLERLLSFTVLAIFIQLLLGAVMRHEEAGLAIPTFPDNFGRIIPHFESTAIVLNFAHRAWALVVTGLVITTFVTIRRHFGSVRALARPASFSIILLVLQVTLGAITILSQKAETPTTLHVSGGAALLGTLFLLRVRAHYFLGRRVLGGQPSMAPGRGEDSEPTLAIQP